MRNLKTRKFGPTLAVLVLASSCADDFSDSEQGTGAINADAAPIAVPPAQLGADASASVPPAADAASAPLDASANVDAGRPVSRVDAGGPGASDAGAASDTGAVADASGDAAGAATATCAVAPIPEALRTSYKLGAIYKRYADANGIPVVASDKPADEAIRRACLLVLDYASVRADVRDTLLRRKVRFIMMAKSEKTVNFPEYAALGDLDMRARGLGGVTDAICAEENVMCDRASDRWRGESICVHEYAHTMHSGAWSVTIPDFNTRLEAAYRAALAAGKYANTYAGEKLSEYLAEGVQDWYNTNLESATPNGIHNHVNKRTELEQYDPALYAILKEVLADKPTYRDCYYYE